MKSLVGALALVALATGSQAYAATGVYTVFSCKGSDGVANAAEGWKPATGGGATASNDCLQGGGLVAQLTGPNPAPASAASWTFTAPANTTIVNMAAQRQTTGVTTGSNGDGKGAPSYHLYLDNSLLDGCEQTNTSQCQSNLTAPISKEGLSGAALSFDVQCGSSSIGPSCQNPIGVVFGQAVVGLRDASAPSVSGARVLDEGARSGTLKVAYSATDLGGGIYNTIVKVDGEPVTTSAVAPGTSCAASGSDPFAFTVPVPCPLSVSDIQAAVPVSQLSAGPHGVEIDVQDAAGNTTAVHGPVQFPAPNIGVTAASRSGAVKAAMKARLRIWFARGRGATLRNRYGNRVVTRGVLRDARGRGIVGARISVYHVRAGKRPRLMKTGLRTRSKGEVTLILPLNLDTRDIEFRYQALVPGPITAKQRLRLRVYRKSGLFVRR